MNKVPISSEFESDGDNRWISIHNRFLSETREKDPDVIFIGDSIIQALQHTDVWNEFFAPLHCLNFGIHGDTIEKVLWRITHGELDHVKPRVIVLHVGTNDHSLTAEGIRYGILDIICEIKQKHSDVYIVVPTLLPRGQHPNPVREKLAKVNELLKSSLNGRSKVQLVEIDKGFIQPDGTISHHDMHDYLLLTNSGSKKAFEPVYELLVQLLNESEIEKDLTPSE
ncbi:platelet-activating factor acetylhydrolase alpha [Leptinotarsa decemlineata]|uniref:platelet-activating factor acetylhydrolase alpha n=1 Tax=Leptinotarsa decemlineata TaxID=7539 RepID=UPI000C253857|nr:platelet-activating factor acetylhydrolase IB subunit beta homolog [Leptinotarsa decemlineata]